MLTLAVALAANTALFSVANAVLLRPLPYSRPDRLFTAASIQPASRARALVSAPDFLAWQRAAAGVAELGAFRPWGFVVGASTDSPAERVAGSRVSANLFPLLGVQPVAGRTFTASEDVFGAPRVALVSQRIWDRVSAHKAVTHNEPVNSAIPQSRNSAMPVWVSPLWADGASHEITLNGLSYSIVGVMPADVRLPAGEVWVPLAFEPFALAQRGTRALTVVARLHDGASAARLADVLTAEAGDLGTRFPDSNRGWGVETIALRDYVAGPIGPTVVMLWWAVALVLLVACANVAGLMLARGGARRRELAVRRAIGASRPRLMRDLFAESLVLAVAAGVAAIPIAYAALTALIAIAPPELASLHDVSIDARVAAFTAVLSLIAGMGFGLVPAVRMSREDLSPLLRAAGAHDGGHLALRHAAIAVQLATAIVVLIGAGLLGRSFARVRAVELGFEPSRLIAMTIATDERYGSAARRAVLFASTLRVAERIPGVAAAGLISHLPLAGGALLTDVTLPGVARDPLSPPLLTNYSAVSGQWTTALGIALLRGRSFSAADSPGGARVAIVSENLAIRLWGTADAIGRRLIVGATGGADTTPSEVVGVVGNVRTAIEAPAPFYVYVPYSQNPWPTMSLAARTEGDPAAVMQSVGRAVAAVDRDQAVYNVRPFAAIVARATATRRFQVLLVWLFAAVAVVLALTGVHGVVAYSARLRAPEMGIRIALGAPRWSVFGLAMSGTLRWGLAGLAIGAAIAAAFGRLAAALLYATRPTDPLIYALAGAAMIALLLAACAAAARRATAIDPLAAIRGE